MQKPIPVPFALLLAACLAGCAQKAGVVFPPLTNAPLFPAPPEPARIRYVGQLATNADLKPAVPFGQAFTSFLFGGKPIRSMLTPYSLCTDGGERLFVTDSNAQLVHVFDLNTRRYQQIVPTPPRQFSQPVGVAYDRSGRLYVADSVAGCIFTFDAAGTPIGTIGQNIVARPCGLAFDPKSNRLLVADAGSHQVVVLSRDGDLITRLGERGMDLGQFNYPTNVAVDSQGRVYVSDSLNFRIQQFSPDYKPIRQIGQKGDLPGYFSQPKGVALDSQDHVYVVDANFEAIQIFSPEGTLLLDFGREGRNPGEFWLPAGICIDPMNRIWIADSYNRRVQVFDYLPEVQP